MVVEYDEKFKALSIEESLQIQNQIMQFQAYTTMIMT